MPDLERDERPGAQAVEGKPGRYLISTGTKYEFQLGYSRAVRHGDQIRLAGTAGFDDEGELVSDDVSGQLRRSLEIMAEALHQLGADMSDVVMTRIYLADMKDADTAAVVHGEVFREIRPATTVVRTDFVDRRILVEIEAEATAPAGSRPRGA